MATTIDWSNLRHAYGDVDNLEALLATISRGQGDRAEAALNRLQGAIAHQGTVYSASAPVLGWILDWLPQAPPVLRRRGVGLLKALAWGEGKRADAAALKKVFKARADELAELVSDPDPAIRLDMTRVLYGKLVIPSKLLQATLKVAEAEDDPHVVFAQLTSPAFLKKPGAKWKKLCLADLNSPLLERRAGAAFGLAVALREEAPDVVVAPLLEALEELEALKPALHKATWSSGSPRVDLANAVSFVGATRLSRTGPALCAQLASAADAPGVAEALLWAAVGSTSFPKTEDGLTGDQRTALRALAGAPSAWRGQRISELIRSVGGPGTREALTQWLGLPCTGMLEPVIRVSETSASVWQHVERCLEDKSYESRDDYFVELHRQSEESALTWLTYLAAVGRGERDLHRHWPVDDRGGSRLLPSLDGEWVKLQAMVPAGSQEELKSLLESQLRQCLEERPEATRLAHALALGWHHAQLGTFPEQFDSVVDCERLHACHVVIPPERLEKLVVKAARRKARALGHPEPGCWGISFCRVAEETARFLELCPSPTLVRGILGLFGLSGIGGSAVNELREAHPLLESVFAEYAQRTQGARSYRAILEAMDGWGDQVFGLVD